MDITGLNVITQWRALSDALRTWRSINFKRGMKVQVNCPQYKGAEIVAYSQEECRADQLAVTLENGNTWWYPLEFCTPVDSCAAPAKGENPQ